MGIKNLWQLLSPVGRSVSIETLSGKVIENIEDIGNGEHDQSFVLDCRCWDWSHRDHCAPMVNRVDHLPSYQELPGSNPRELRFSPLANV